MAETLYQHPEIKHGTIKIGFTPDEEIGKGAALFDVKRFGADFAYTVDGASYNEVEYETFNAAAADVLLHGVSIHTGDAKDKLVNASLLAMEFHSLLPERERPEYTEKYEGFYHLDRLEGIVDQAKMHYILRDHDINKLNDKKAVIIAAAAKLNEKYGQNTVHVEIKDSYFNMAEQIKPHWHLIDSAYEAIRELGGTLSAGLYVEVPTAQDYPLWVCLVLTLEPEATITMGKLNLPACRQWINVWNY
jgi:tripeptide aminopeptidase